MKVKVIEVIGDGQTFDGQIERSMTILGQFMDFRNVRTLTQKVVLTDEQYLRYKDSVGKDVELEVVPHTAKYGFQLAS